LPDEFYQQTLTHLDFMKKAELYAILQDIPKGALHHDHFNCNEDK
jgi:hypothetical protein